MNSSSLMPLATLFFAASAWLTRPLEAATISIVITGTVGYWDTNGLFGPPSDTYATAPFTLTFSFDDALGTQTATCQDNSCSSGLYGVAPSSPGIASLSIGSGTYVFGKATSSSSGVFFSDGGQIGVTDDEDITDVMYTTSAYTCSFMPVNMIFDWRTVSRNCPYRATSPYSTRSLSVPKPAKTSMQRANS
jgi:hypothetical protein